MTRYQNFNTAGEDKLLAQQFFCILYHIMLNLHLRQQILTRSSTENECVKLHTLFTPANTHCMQNFIHGKNVPPPFHKKYTDINQDSAFTVLL